MGKQNSKSHFGPIRKDFDNVHGDPRAVDSRGEQRRQSRNGWKNKFDFANMTSEDYDND